MRWAKYLRSFCCLSLQSLCWQEHRAQFDWQKQLSAFWNWLAGNSKLFSKSDHSTGENVVDSYFITKEKGNQKIRQMKQCSWLCMCCVVYAYKTRLTKVSMACLCHLVPNFLFNQQCISLLLWLEERYETIYTRHPGFQKGSKPLLALDKPFPMQLPENLFGEKWAFVQLPFSGTYSDRSLLRPYVDYIGFISPRTSPSTRLPIHMYIYI